MQKKWLKEIIFGVFFLLIVSNIINFLRAPNVKATIRNKDIQILYFYTSWCKICKLENPEIEALKDNLFIKKIDAEKEIEMAKRFQVKAYPTLFYMKDGEVLYTDIGYTSRFTMRAKYFILNYLK